GHDHLAAERILRDQEVHRLAADHLLFHGPEAGQPVLRQGLSRPRIKAAYKMKAPSRIREGAFFNAVCRRRRRDQCPPLGMKRRPSSTTPSTCWEKAPLPVPWRAVTASCRAGRARLRPCMVSALGRPSSPRMVVAISMLPAGPVATSAPSPGAATMSRLLCS